MGQLSNLAEGSIKGTHSGEEPQSSAPAKPSSRPHLILLVLSP